MQRPFLNRRVSQSFVQKVELSLLCKGLANADNYSKSDPFVVVYKYETGGRDQSYYLFFFLLKSIIISIESSILWLWNAALWLVLTRDYSKILGSHWVPWRINFRHNFIFLANNYGAQPFNVMSWQICSSKVFLIIFYPQLRLAWNWKNRSYWRWFKSRIYDKIWSQL